MAFDGLFAQPSLRNNDVLVAGSIPKTRVLWSQNALLSDRIGRGSGRTLGIFSWRTEGRDLKNKMFHVEHF
jgi:hypothetical protein